MPRYNQKITRLMPYPEFQHGLERIDDPQHRAFLSILYLYGCRVSEALALRFLDTRFSDDYCYIRFQRLKGSHQTDPVQRPLTPELRYLWHPREETHDFPLFRFSRMTAYRLVQRAFPTFYPHYFRMNAITTTFQLGASVAEVQADFGITTNAIQHYMAKVSQARVGRLWAKALTN